MVMGPDFDDLFEARINYPDADARERLASLVGLDEHKTRVSRMLGLLINPRAIETWLDNHHPGAKSALTWVLMRPPLVVLAGDVGCGKSQLAETIGDAVAREQKVDLTLFPLSLSTRGQGRVGEMTQLLSAAFEYTAKEAARYRSEDGPHRSAIILLVDEADALAQSRETSQMHHEDRAGVNAFIRGVDRLANSKLPAAVIMCTNRLGALDPAVRRRAADILTFSRPDDVQRRAVLGPPLKALGFAEETISAVVAATGPHGDGYGFTFSDLTQRLLPAVVLDAFPDGPVDPNHAVTIASDMAATPPFLEARSQWAGIDQGVAGMNPAAGSC